MYTTTRVPDEVLGAIVQFAPAQSLQPVLTAHRRLPRVAPAWHLDAFRSALSYYAVPNTRNIKHFTHYLSILAAPHLLRDSRDTIVQVRLFLSLMHTPPAHKRNHSFACFTTVDFERHMDSDQ